MARGAAAWVLLLLGAAGTVSGELSLAGEGAHGHAEGGLRMRKLAPPLFSAERHKGGGWALRMQEVKVDQPNSGNMFVVPEVALKSNTGARLGISLSARDRLLLLGFGGNGIMGGRGDIGGYFYTDQDLLQDVPIISTDQEDLMTGTSDVLACFSQSNQMQCYIYSRRLADARRPKAEVFKIAPVLDTPRCTFQTVGCFARVFSVWNQAVAVVGKTTDGKAYVSTHYLSGSPLFWNCTAGCNGFAAGSLLSSAEATWGSSVALGADLLAVGVPAGAGKVVVLRAAGGAEPHGYGGHTSWVQETVLMGPSQGAGFGTSVSISDDYLVVGAPGNRSHAAAAHVYKIARAQGSPTTVSLFCTTVHNRSTAHSNFGFSLAQASKDGDTMLLVGAPGENLVYSFLLRHAADQCTPLEAYGPPLEDQSVSDQFGYSIAISDQYVMIGAPFYKRYFKPDVSGLIFTDAMCFPGYVIQNTDLMTRTSIYTYKSCGRCGPSQTSDGGRDAQCDQCVVEVPKQNAVLTYGCLFQCVTGYFGDACVLCSVLNADVPKPPNTHWKDGAATCDWECDGGYSEERFPNGTRYCQQCGNTPFFQELSNVAWLVASCEWECALGFFRDPMVPQDQNCYLCSALYAGNPNFYLPPNAEWMDGLDECIWGPKIGYTCTGDVCTPCPAVPPNSELTDTAPTKARARCGYSCVSGYFGHPTYDAICTLCPDLMTNTAMAPLPTNAFWPSSPLVCNASSWVCSSGYNRSGLADFCCPPMPIANSFYKPDYIPCGYACDLSYRWVNATASCEACGFSKPNSDWLLDCDYSCKATFFGRKELDECVSCREYRTRIATPLPPNSAFPVTSTNCTAKDWECAAGFTKSTDAVPAGCCPNLLPSDRALRLPGTQNVELCGYTCLVGFRWNRNLKLCEVCNTTTSTASPPPHSEWHPESCAYVCKQGYVTIGVWASQTAPLQCLECGEYAVREGWTTPANSVWQNSSTIVGACTDNSWYCFNGYLKNAEAKLCCPRPFLPIPGANALPPRSTWDSSSCNWNCLPTFFPDRLSRQEQSCVTCTEYLDRVSDVDFCSELVEFSPTSSRCQGRKRDTAPTECSLSVQTEVEMTGLTVNTFSEDVRLLTLMQLNLISNSTGGGDVKLLFVENIVVQPGRRQTVVGPEPGVQVGTQINKVSPLAVRSVIAMMQTAFPSGLQTALASIGIKAIIKIRGDPSAIYGPGSWSCSAGYVYNPETETCCRTSIFDITAATTFRLPPSRKDRYVWKENGCDWTCKDTYQGADCQTCTEFKEGKWKPSNSQWDDTSPSCTWNCLPGYVKSDRGDTCISVQELIRDCDSANRCALCVERTNCVWCASEGKCVPGSVGPASTGPGFGCPYVNLAEGEIAASTERCVCSTSADTCFDECKYDDCGGCVADQFCGWCANKSKCMLGEYSRPRIESCAAGEGWSTGVYTRCNDDTSIWLIGLICASVSTVLVGAMCCYFVLRVRAAAREQQMHAAHGTIRFGGIAPPANGGPVVTEALLATFPVFTYSMKEAAQALSNTAPAGNAAEETRPSDDGDEDPVCTICLGTFCDGEDCRMLPCLHVFHKACIDQWLGVSQECPLCKQSVLGEASQSTAFAEASRRVGGVPPPAAEEVDPDPGNPPPGNPPVPRESVDIAL